MPESLALCLLLMGLALILWGGVVRGTGSRARDLHAPADPEHELHSRRAALAVSDNLLNRLALALTCLKHGRYKEAVEQFENLDAGEGHNDPLVLLGLARSQFGLEQYQAAKHALDRLITANPNFRSEAGHLLYARSLEALGEVHDALHEYEVLTSYSPAPEAHCRHALLLTSLGRPREAKALYQSLLRGMRGAPRHYARLHHQWIVLAEREIAALAA